MNAPITGSTGYPLITFRMKNGKFDRAEVEGNTAEQNAAFTERITPRPADEIAAKMAEVNENTKPNCEGRNGRLVTLKQTPAYFYGDYREGDKFQSKMREKMYTEMYEVFANGADMDTVEQTLRDVVKQMDEYMYSEGYPTGSKEYTKQLIQDSCQAFRQELLRAANRACEVKGDSLYPYDGQKASCKYYDSDFYYKSEDALAVLTEAVKELGGDMGLQDFNLNPKGSNPNLTYNFNSVWSMSMTISNMVDPTIPPPKDFSFYMNRGRDGFGEVKVGNYTKRFPDDVGMSHYKFLDDTVQVSKGDTPDADSVNRFLENMCYFDMWGRLNLRNDDRWTNRHHIKLDTKA